MAALQSMCGILTDFEELSLIIKAFFGKIHLEFHRNGTSQKKDFWYFGVCSKSKQIVKSLFHNLTFHPTSQSKKNEINNFSREGLI